VEHFRDDALANLLAAAGDRNFNPGSVYEGLGYMRDPKVFDKLLERVHGLSAGSSGIRQAVAAVGIQNDKRSLAALKDVANKLGENFESFDSGLIEGLRQLRDKDALAYLKELQPRIKYHAKLPYVRARAAHGDGWAIGQLLAAADVPAHSDFLGNDFWNRQDVGYALCDVDTPEATAALKLFVQEQWPAKTNAEGWHYAAYLGNAAGAARRQYPLGEIARRDPRWLAELALEKLNSPVPQARWFAADVFAQLTGHPVGFGNDAFASQRAAAQGELQTWWRAHREESREQWLVAAFRSRGFAMERLDKNAIPVLVRALEGDALTHQLALEQISAICQKYFVNLPEQPSYQGQERINIRVTGWLRARGYLPAATQSN
jgi:hypothetical protein